MKAQIEKRIEELKAKHAQIEKDIQYAQKMVQEKIAEINSVVGAISELENLLKQDIKPE